ncbi:hypothetical protein BTVI_154565 [Pitangus sulphuratus]|nr:hypothetical protein BTVI_154565 [Pitangus sulphuratus]
MRMAGSAVRGEGTGGARALRLRAEMGRICTGLVDERRTVDNVYLDFSKTFKAIPHKVIIKKLLKYELDEQTVKWVENWRNVWAQR